MRLDASTPPVYPGVSIETLRAELRAEVPASRSGEALVARYRANYAIPSSLDLTERMVLEHWKLERELTRRLLASPPGGRAAAFREAYETLYGSLPWLNVGDDAPRAWEEILVGDLLGLLGPPPLRVLELGAGRGRVATRLAAAGHNVMASDLAAERRPVRTAADRRPEWVVLDAVRPDLVGLQGACDAVVSNQMIEHLHPEDVSVHFTAVLRLLRPGGRYVFTTPHADLGPADLSRVYGANQPMGMHLREYKVKELRRTALEAGFARLTAGWRPPLRLARLFRGGAPAPGAPAMRESEAYRRWLEAWEGVLALIPQGPRRRAAARALRLVLFREVPLVAHRAG